VISGTANDGSRLRPHGPKRIHELHDEPRLRATRRRRLRRLKSKQRLASPTRRAGLPTSTRTRRSSWWWRSGWVPGQYGGLQSTTACYNATAAGTWRW
jgi:hypothetical protein